MNYCIDKSAIGQTIKGYGIIMAIDFDKQKQYNTIRIRLANDNNIETFKITIFDYNLKNKYIAILDENATNAYISNDIYYDTRYNIFALMSDKARFIDIIAYNDIVKLNECGIYPIRILRYDRQ